MIQLNELVLNPDNPRVIKDKAFKKLKESVAKFPDMLVKRPIVYDVNKVILAGNQRYAALLDLGYKEIPDEWAVSSEGWTQDQINMFVVMDNHHAGTFDFQKLRDNWADVDLVDWGLELPNWSFNSPKLKEEEIKPFIKTHVLISFPPEKLLKIQPLLEQIKNIVGVEYEQASN